MTTSKRSPARQVTAPRSSPREKSLLRIVAQGLVAQTQAPDPAEAVRRQLAIQGQQPSAVPHAILSRVPAGLTRQDVDAAFQAGALVRSWPMRGTVHITTAADHHWLRLALAHRMETWMAGDRRRYGLDEAVLERAGTTALTALGSAHRDGRTGLTRAELVSAWQEAGVLRPLLERGMPEPDARRHLVLALHVTGVLVQGPRQGNEHLLIDATQLPGAHLGPGGSGGGHGSDGHRQALAEIARRYATSHGPVSAADLARWTTLPVGESRQALEDAVEVTNAADFAAGQVDAALRGLVPLVRAVAEGGDRGRVRVLEGPAGAGGAASPGSRRAGEVLYMRADLPDMLSRARAAAQGTLFLASFDELHVGYKDRLCLTDEAGERLICPSMNGMFRPLLVDRGRVVAVRPAGQALVWAQGARRSARLERDVERAVGRMASRLRTGQD
nr:crosslink repair DNA glycosylase YcaQ family protein [Actinomyces sp.]